MDYPIISEMIKSDSKTKYIIKITDSIYEGKYPEMTPVKRGLYYKGKETEGWGGAKRVKLETTEDIQEAYAFDSLSEATQMLKKQPFVDHKGHGVMYQGEVLPIEQKVAYYYSFEIKAKKYTGELPPDSYASEKEAAEAAIKSIREKFK